MRSGDRSACCRSPFIEESIMKKFAFISRHEPNADQKSLAEKAGIELVHVGDRDGFHLKVEEFAGFNGVVVVHAAAAMKALQKIDVGVFNNINRAPLGEKPQFGCTELHLYYMHWSRGIEFDFAELRETVFAL